MTGRWNSWRGGLAGVLLVSTVVAGATAAVGATRSGALSGQSVPLIGLVTGVLTTVVFQPAVPLPRRRVTALLVTTWARVGIVCLALGTLGYVGVFTALSPWLIAGLGGALGVSLSVWFWTLARGRSSGRTLVVGDDPSLIASTARSVPGETIGIVSPSLVSWERDRTDAVDSGERMAMTDGGITFTDIVTDGGRPVHDFERVGGLSRLESVLQHCDIDTVALAFAEGDREEFFGVLQTCHDYGVDVLVHESLADHVLADERVTSSLVRVDLEPIRWYSRIAKRAFDIVFAVVGLVTLAPLIALIAIAIKVDSPGPVLYSQTRTTELGDEFTVSKFRSMVTDAEAETGATLSDEDAGDVDPRVTRVGRLLRTTHMDEIPQLAAVLTGKMSAVGPRPERPELDAEIQADGIDWSKRWFVKPGLTGISQINGITGYQPGKKLTYDIEYARRQSLWLDSKLVVLQILTVVEDVYGLVFDSMDEGDGHVSRDTTTGSYNGEPTTETSNESEEVTASDD